MDPTTDGMTEPISETKLEEDVSQETNGVEVKSEETKDESEKKEAETNQESDSFPFRLDEMEKLLMDFFKGMESLISTTHQKDKNLIELSNQLSLYRAGMKSVFFKSMSSYLITFRESLVRQWENLGKFDYELDTMKNHFSMFEDSIDSLFQDIDLEEDKDTWTYNGKDIDRTYQPKELEELPPFQEEPEDMEKPEIHSMDDFSLFLKKMEGKEIKALKGKEYLDVLSSRLVALENEVREQQSQVILYPVLRKLVHFRKNLIEKIETIKNVEDKTTYLYSFKLAMEELISEMDDILLSSGITIESLPEIESDYDPKTEMSLGYVLTKDREDLHGKVAESYTPCYMFEDKVLKKAKIKLYRFVK